MITQFSTVTSHSVQFSHTVIINGLLAFHYKMGGCWTQQQPLSPESPDHQFHESGEALPLCSTLSGGNALEQVLIEMQLNSVLNTPPPHPMVCQVAVASEDPSAPGGHGNQPHPGGPARAAAEPGAAQPGSPLRQPTEYESAARLSPPLKRTRVLPSHTCASFRVWNVASERLHAEPAPRQRPQRNLHRRVSVIQVLQ